MTREKLSGKGFVEEQKIYIIQNDNRKFTTELFKLILIFHGLVDLLQCFATEKFMDKVASDR